MKKIFTILFALLTVSQVWAISKTQLTVNISGNGQIAVNTSASKPSTWSSTSVTKNQGHGTFDVWVDDTYYIWVNPANGYYCSGVSDCSWDNNGYYTITFTGSTGTTSKTVTATFVGNSYTVTFNGNGATSGNMNSQAFVYGTAQNLSANAYVRAFNVTYNANEGECAETEAAASATFDGWAKSATGAVVYSNQQSLSTPTPLPAHNSTIDLFAKWTDGTVVLPEVSREGYLFDGWYNGDTWVGVAGATYAPTADVELTAHWAERLTPVFVLDKTEIELDQTATLTMNNVSNPSIVITPEGIVNYDAETGVLTGVGVGEVMISATQEETSLLSYKHEELTLTVNKKTPSLSVFLNGIEQNSVVIYQGKTGTVTFDKVSDAEVVVEAISGAQYASYQNGVLTAGEVGTATFRATLPETNTYQSTYLDFQVETQRDPIHLPMDFTQALWNNPDIKVGTNNTVAWDGDNGVHLGDGLGGGLTYNDKWFTVHFVGIPDKLSFEYSYDYKTEGTKPSAVFTGQSTDPNKMYFLFVEESADGNSWSALTWQDTDPFRNSWKQSGALQLKKTTRYVRFHFNANLGAYYRNIHISELKYVNDPDPSSIDFGSAIIYSGEVSEDINVNWCNIAPLYVTCSNPRFTVTPSVFANYDQYGSQTIHVSYTHTDEVGDNEGDITISNGNDTYTKTIHVHAATTKRVQTVTWNAELEATGFAMNVDERYPDQVITVIATTQNGEPIVFTSSDSEVIEVIDDTILVAKAQGTAEITAYQAGSNEYEEVSDTKVFTVTELMKQSISWEQNLFGLLTTSEPVELNATATSGMEIVYVSADESVVRVDSNMLVVVGEGETYITATQAGGVDSLGVEWLPISATNYVIVRNPASQCNEMALSQGSFELGSDMQSREFVLSGIPAELTFTAKHGTKSTQWGTGATYAALVVEQYAYINGVWDWYTIYNKVVGTDDTQSGTLNLSETATKVRFMTGETAVNHTISNVRIPRKKFMRADVTAVDEQPEANAIWQKTITVSHSNIDLMTVATKQGLINLSVATLGEGCGDYGDDAFVASFTPMAKGVEYNDTIVITDGKADPTTLLIPVHFYSTGLKQYITGFELPATCGALDHVTVPAATTTAGLEVIFLSSDSTVAYVENGELVILAAGTVAITAYQAGDDRYNEASQTKTIVITPVAVEITEVPLATELAEGAPLGMSLLIGGSASVEGSFAWENPGLVPTQTGDYNVVFTPVDPIYATTIVPVEVSVSADAAMYGLYTATICEGDSVEFEGLWYYDATDEPQIITLENELNMYGGDSVVIFSVVVYPVEYVDQYEDLHAGDTLRIEPNVWFFVEGGQKIPMGDAEYEMPEATSFELIRKEQTENGCDKIITLHVTVAEALGTGVENVQDGDVRATKVLRDGTIYILRDGKEYTITGLEVR